MEGYDTLSTSFSYCEELCIYRKFSRLRHRSQMLLQAELMEKEEQLLSLITDDRKSGDPKRKSFSMNFDALLKDQSELGCRQRKLMTEIIHVLKKYVRKPNLVVLEDAVLRNTPDRGLFFENTVESGTWFEEENEYDMTSLLDRDGGTDILTSWLTWVITKPYHRLFGKQEVISDRFPRDWKPLHPIKLSRYKDEHIARLVTVLATVLAPILPTAGAFCLYFIHDELLRLCMIVLLSFLFSSAVAIVGMPRRIDSFIATASFSAVLIVFVSPNGN
ncbi:hypothetical protein LTS17_002567 [Exophiala oligosperma]